VKSRPRGSLQEWTAPPGNCKPKLPTATVQLGGTKTLPDEKLPRTGHCQGLLPSAVAGTAVRTAAVAATAGAVTGRAVIAVVAPAAIAGAATATTWRLLSTFWQAGAKEF